MIIVLQNAFFTLSRGINKEFYAPFQVFSENYRKTGAISTNACLKSVLMQSLNKKHKDALERNNTYIYMRKDDMKSDDTRERIYARGFL